MQYPLRDDRATAHRLSSNVVQLPRAKPTRLPPHSIRALQIQNELARLAAHRREAGGPPLAAAGIAFVVARSLIFVSGRVNFDEFTRTCERLKVEVPDDETVVQQLHAAAAEAALGRQCKMPAADVIGALFAVSSEERAAAMLKAIGAVDETAAARRKRTDAERKRRARAERGAKSHDQSDRRSRPWEAAGVSRATWYRSLSRSSETNSSAPLLSNIGKADEMVSRRPPRAVGLQAAATCIHCRSAAPPARFDETLACTACGSIVEDHAHSVVTPTGRKAGASVTRRPAPPPRDRAPADAGGRHDAIPSPEEEKPAMLVADIEKNVAAAVREGRVRRPLLALIVDNVREELKTKTVEQLTAEVISGGGLADDAEGVAA